MVSTDPKSEPEPRPGYVYVDWGPEFYTRHSGCFPNFSGPSLTANIGWLGLQHVLASGGSGYFPMRIVLPYVEARRLTVLHGAPEFIMPAYVVYPVEHNKEIFDSALAIMHRVAKLAAQANRPVRPSRTPATKMSPTKRRKKA